MVEDIPEIDDLQFEEQTTKKQVMPAYEIVKRDILFSWFRIEVEYKEFVRLTSLGKAVRIENLSAQIITLYKTMLRTMIKHTKLKEFGEDFIKEMDGYCANYKITEKEIPFVIDKISDFLYSIGLLNIAHEIKPWQQSFREGYPV